MVSFSKYVAILTFLVVVVITDYNKTKFVVKLCPIKYMLSLKVNDLLLKRKLADFQIEWHFCQLKSYRLSLRVRLIWWKM